MPNDGSVDRWMGIGTIVGREDEKNEIRARKKTRISKPAAPF